MLDEDRGQIPSRLSLNPRCNSAPDPQNAPMLIATPHPDAQPASPPDWMSIDDALKKLKVRKRVLRRDWRSEVAAVDGAWLVWALSEENYLLSRHKTSIFPPLKLHGFFRSN
jgi:hypothetical protein